MAAQSASPAASLRGGTKLMDGETRIYLRLLMIWHGALAAVGLAAAIYLLITPNDLAEWIRGVLIASALGLTLTSGIAALDIFRMKHRGRVLSLIVNYILFTVCAFGLMHLVGLFIAIDNLADTFPQGIPYLGIALLGYLSRAFSDHYENIMMRQHRLFQRIGGWLAMIGLALFALVSILLPLLNHIWTEWNTPILALVGIGLGLAAAGLKWGWRGASDQSGVVLGLSAVGVILLAASLWLEFENRLTVVFLIGGVITAALMWMMWRFPTGAVFRATISGSEMVEGLMFLSPNLLGFVLFFVGPLLFSLFVSFTEWDAFGTQEWIGLNNYAEIFDLKIAAIPSAGAAFDQAMDATRYAELTRLNVLGMHYVIGAQDKLFWISLWNTLAFGLLAVPLSVIPALLLAVILNTKLRGMAFFRAVYFLPSIAAVVGVALIWRWLYNSTVGWLNFFITTGVGIINGAAGGEVLVDPQIGWLSETNVALLAVVIVAAWQWIGFNTVLFLAGLQGIPGDLHEAATVDGAGAWVRFWKITLPMLAPTTFFVVSTRIITAMQLFDQVFVMTNPPGGPGTSTMTVTLHLYRMGFQNFRQGYASAIAWVLFLLIFGITLAQFQRQRGTMAYDG